MYKTEIILYMFFALLQNVIYCNKNITYLKLKVYLGNEQLRKMSVFNTLDRLITFTITSTKSGVNFVPSTETPVK